MLGFVCVSRATNISILAFRVRIGISRFEAGAHLALINNAIIRRGASGFTLFGS